MKLSGHVVLVTGGGSGIGLAIARRFLAAGSDVIVCGRGEDKLREAQRAHPRLEIQGADLSTEIGRIALHETILERFPAVDVLVNNAGIQRRITLADPEPWGSAHEEVAINFEAPVHLSRLFIPHLARQQTPAIVNVTSGLSFVPLAHVPIYCATKAAMHSFTLSLRHQLRGTPIEVIEIIPPAVNTDLGGPGLHTFGVNVDEFADAVMARVDAGEQEVAYGFAEESSRAGREKTDAMFARMNDR